MDINDDFAALVDAVQFNFHQVGYGYMYHGLNGRDRAFFVMLYHRELDKVLGETNVCSRCQNWLRQYGDLIWYDRKGYPHTVWEWRTTWAKRFQGMFDTLDMFIRDNLVYTDEPAKIGKANDPFPSKYPHLHMGYLTMVGLRIRSRNRHYSRQKSLLTQHFLDPMYKKRMDVVAKYLNHYDDLGDIDIINEVIKTVIKILDNIHSSTATDKKTIILGNLDHIGEHQYSIIRNLNLLMYHYRDINVVDIDDFKRYIFRITKQRNMVIYKDMFPADYATYVAKCNAYVHDNHLDKLFQRRFLRMDEPITSVWTPTPGSDEPGTFTEVKEVTYPWFMRRILPTLQDIYVCIDNSTMVYGITTPVDPSTPVVLTYDEPYVIGINIWTNTLASWGLKVGDCIKVVGINANLLSFEERTAALLLDHEHTRKDVGFDFPTYILDKRKVNRDMVSTYLAENKVPVVEGEKGRVGVRLAGYAVTNPLLVARTHEGQWIAYQVMSIYQ